MSEQVPCGVVGSECYLKSAHLKTLVMLDVSFPT